MRSPTGYEDMQPESATETPGPNVHCRPMSAVRPRRAQVTQLPRRVAPWLVGRVRTVPAALAVLLLVAAAPELVRVQFVAAAKVPARVQLGRAEVDRSVLNLGPACWQMAQRLETRTRPRLQSR